MIGHLYRLARSLVHEASTARSSKWPAVERAWRAANPTCAACGGAARLQVHHKLPFHLDPALELDVTNLISLCMSPLDCHIRIGHGDDFKAYNPDVEADAAQCLRSPGMRPVVEAKAKAGRRVDVP